jgi:uncharacterized protein (DUF433 family)
MRGGLAMTGATDRHDHLNRFTDPLYTSAEAGRYLGLPSATLSRWANGYRAHHAGRPDTVGAAVITSLSRRGGARGPVIPFVGLAEGYTLAAIRASGVPLQRIRPALGQLQREIGVEHALASQRLFTDGAEVLFDYAEHIQDESVASATRELVVVRNGQRVLNDIVKAYLQRIDFAADGYAQAIPLPGYTAAELVVDTRRGFGQPVFLRGGARLEDVLALFYAGESLSVAAEEYGVPFDQIEDALRIAARQAA